MSDLIRFGKIETITDHGNGVIEHITQTVHDFTQSTPKRRFTRSDIVDSDQQILAEALKLMDLLKQDDIEEVGLCISKRKSGNKYKFDVSWMPR